MSNELNKIMQSCEDKAGQIADTFRNIGKEFESIGLIDRIEKELAGKTNGWTMGIKEAIGNKTTSKMQILKEVKQMLEDGWKGLSPELSNQILNF